MMEMRDKIDRSQIEVKVIARHAWEMTIERVFADAKEKHGMRYTHYREIDKVRMELNLLFGCMNLKN